MDIQSQPRFPEWILKDESGKSVCTFIPSTISRVKMTRFKGTGTYTEDFVRVRLSFKDDKSTEAIIPVSGLDRIDWSKIDDRCIVNSRFRNAKGYIANIIRAGLHDAPEETKYSLNQLGFHNIEGLKLFVAGDRVFTPSSASNSNLNYELGILDFNLNIDESLTPEKAFEGLKELANICPEVSRILIAHTILGIMRAAFEKVGSIPSTILVVVGRSGMLKSHYIPHMVQLYNRVDGIGPTTRFNSTKRFIEEVACKYRHCTMVVDDLHTAESRGIMKRNEDTAEEFIRRIGDNLGRGRMEGHTQVQNQFEGNVVYIGEYNIGKASTIPRELIVNITKTPDSNILDKYQRKQPLLVSTFYSYFIQWYIDNFDEIYEEIDSALTYFREKNKNSSVHKRLLDAQFYLRISYMFFVKFCKSYDFCIEREAKNEYQDFCKELEKLIQEQQARYDMDREPSPVDYLKVIQHLYEKGNFKIAKNEEKFSEDKHDGLIYYDCLCLRGGRLDKKLGKIIPDYERADCIKSLKDKRALKCYKGKNTVQIGGLNGRRFYAIKLKNLH